MKWGIIGAMPSEIALIKDQMEDVCEQTIGRFVFYDGMLLGKEATLVQCGIGKVNAAMVTQMLIDRYAVDCVVNTGIAGALHSDLKILDVVISRELCYHDSKMFVNYVPFLEKIVADESLVELAVEAFEHSDHGSSCCFTGRIATGDQFIESKEVKQSIVERLHPMCVEMEGAAIGHVCAANDVPFVVIRTMSDNADEEAPENAIDFEAVGVKHSSDIVLDMIRRSRK